MIIEFPKKIEVDYELVYKIRTTIADMIKPKCIIKNGKIKLELIDE